MSEPQRFRRISKFELHELIGEGAMGVVWKAYDTVLRRYVALKLLHTSVGKTKDMRERFLREARAAGALQHPNILTIYDLGEAEGGHLFIAMELVEGRDLSDLIASSEPLALERKLDIVIEMLEGLNYAHQRGVIHRDIKPANVRIGPDGRVKIMDFGIARLQTADATESGAIIGTPTYMAPEQITNGPITPVTDVFSAGCVLYELLSYRKPFSGESVHGVLYQVLTTDPKPLRTMAPSIPASLERVVMKAMNKVPEERYDDAKQMENVLVGIRAALSGGTDSTTQRLGPRWTPLPGPILKLITHAPLKWRLTVLSALAVVALALLWVSGAQAPPEPLAGGTRGLRPPGQTSPPPPATLNPALGARRDSAFAARDRAVRSGAVKNNVPSVVVAEAMWEASEQALRNGDQARALNGYVGVVRQYGAAEREANQLQDEARRYIDRVTPVVQALGQGPDAARAAVSLARAESLFTVQDYTMAKAVAQSAEQIGIDAGIAPPSPQPAGARQAIDVLLSDLERAVASGRVSNIRVLSPTMTPRDLEQWAGYFRGKEQLTVKYTVRAFAARGAAASAEVQAVHKYVQAGVGTPLEDRLNFAMQFTRTANGWRIISVRQR